MVSCSAFVLLLLERRGARWLEALFGVVIGVEAVRVHVDGRIMAANAVHPLPAAAAPSCWAASACHRPAITFDPTNPVAP